MDEIKDLVEDLSKGKPLTDDEALDNGRKVYFDYVDLLQRDPDEAEEIFYREDFFLHGFHNYDDFLIALGRGEEKAKDAMFKVIGKIKRTS